MRRSKLIHALVIALGTLGLVACGSSSSPSSGNGSGNGSGNTSGGGSTAKAGFATGATSCNETTPVTGGSACAKCANTNCCQQALACAGQASCVTCFVDGTGCDSNDSVIAGALSCVETSCGNECGTSGGGGTTGGGNANCWTIDCSAGCPDYCTMANQTCPSSGKCGSS